MNETRRKVMAWITRYRRGLRGWALWLFGLAGLSSAEAGPIIGWVNGMVEFLIANPTQGVALTIVSYLAGKGAPTGEPAIETDDGPA